MVAPPPSLKILGVRAVKPEDPNVKVNALVPFCSQSFIVAIDPLAKAISPWLRSQKAPASEEPDPTVMLLLFNRITPLLVVRVLLPVMLTVEFAGKFWKFAVGPNTVPVPFIVMVSPVAGTVFVSQLVAVSQSPSPPPPSQTIGAACEVAAARLRLRG